MRQPEQSRTRKNVAHGRERASLNAATTLLREDLVLLALVSDHFLMHRLLRRHRRLRLGRHSASAPKITQPHFSFFVQVAERKEKR
jgi:hypothetical protein